MKAKALSPEKYFFLRRIFIFFLSNLLAVSSFISCKQHKKTSADSQVSENVVAVKTVPATRKNLNIPIHCSGILTSNAEIKLAFKVGGVVERIYVKEGQFVRRGQLLAQLNLSEISSQVQQARVSVEKSSRDLQRTKNLYADTVTTLEQVQNATSGLDVAKANLQMAEFNLRFASIVAPVNGQILKRLSEPNEIIASGNPVFLLGSADEAWVVTVGLSDKDVIRIQENDKASISLDAYPNEIFEAFVSQIDQTSNRGSGTYEVKLQINPKGKRMVSGFIAKGQILPKNQQNPLVIPIEALSEADGNTAYVFVLNTDNQTVKKIKISIADIYENQVAVREGLEENQNVVVAGVAYLSPESKVRVAGKMDN